ncbi:MAG: prepilin-type N-terminal cleavage/methylation domain-containing protein [Candidatus Sumerlaeaceae bacterium]|nr:prepilin-type N-terminal cleavage/methylation domain-containing protein [Candidatus Sumerlaeaceae bacterium]
MRNQKGFTLLELLVVVLILSLLATMVVGMYLNQMNKARIAVAQGTIREIEHGALRYQLDLGVFPPSLSLNPAIVSGGGCGFVYEALVHSVGGTSQNPSDSRWTGPYISVENVNLDQSGGDGNVQILDPWRTPYRFVRKNDYAASGTPLPSGSPYIGETWYNPQTVQVVSYGADGLPGNAGLGTFPNNLGEGDDVTNFGL